MIETKLKVPLFIKVQGRNGSEIMSSKECQVIRVKSKYNQSSMKIIGTLCLVLILCMAESQVIGIDFGTQFWKASLISPGKNLVIVENSRSGRKSYNGITFLDGIRHFEYDAFIKRQKKPKSSYFYLNKLIESLDSETPVQGFLFKDGTYHITEGEDTITLEQLVGMIIKNIKKYSSQQAGSDIKDAVFTVPAHWGFKAKFALINAAYLADISVLGVINENSAAAIHFAITRNDSDPVNIGFFNMGSHNFQMSIVQFFGTTDTVREKNIESMRVLSHVSVPNFGGLRVDLALAEHVARQFKAKHGVDIHENLRAWTKLLHKVSDVKQTLSANKEVNIFIEGLINGIDLNMVIKREVLEQIPMFSQISTYLQKAVDQAGITKDQIQSVQIIGGASRIPIVGRILKEFFDPVEVGSHINGDQSMAFGAALRAANLSIAFRVKQLHFYDGNPEPIRAVITNIEDGVLSDNLLFDKDSEHGLRKEITIDQCQEDAKVSIYYGEEIVHEYLLSNVSQWKQKYNRSALNFTEQPKIVLIFAAHSTNFAELKEAYVNITLNTWTTKQVYEVIVENVTIEEKSENKSTAEEGEKKKETEEKKNDDTNTDNKSEEQKSEQAEKQQTQESEKTEESEKSESAEKKEESSEKPQKRTRERTRNVKKIVDDFKIQNKKYFIKPNHQFSKFHRFTKEESEKLKEVFYRYEKHENDLKEKAKIRNDFESTLYALKDDFQNPGLKTFGTEEQINKLKESVIEEISWLDENAWTAGKSDFEKHFKTIQNLYSPIVNRSNQYKHRESAYNKTFQILSIVYQKTVELNESQPWVQEKAEAHLKKINETVEWIHEKLKKQVDRKLNENVVFYNHQMIDKAEDLRDQYYLIKMIPRPKVTKKVEVETPKAPQTDEKVDLDEEQKEKQKSKTEQTGEEEDESEQKQKDDL